MLCTNRARAINPGLAAELLAEHFGLSGAVAPLPGYSGINYKLTAADQAYVIKFTEPAGNATLLDMENAALNHLSQTAPPFSYPALITTVGGEEIVAVAAAGEDSPRYLMRVICWLDGEVYARVQPQTATLQNSLGALLAHSAIAFSEFDHPAAYRQFQWDLAQLASLKPLLSLYSDSKRKLLAHHLNAFCQQALPALAACPRQIIHNDGNDYNVLVSIEQGRSRCSGLIDFGDMVYSYRVFDLAVAMAYALFRQKDVAAAAHAVVSGYEQRLPLQPAEKDYLYHLITARLVQSLLLSAASYKARPDNEYLLVSAQPAWELLQSLHGLGWESFRAAL